MLNPFNEQAWCEIEQIRRVFSCLRGRIRAREVDWETAAR